MWSYLNFRKICFTLFCKKNCELSRTLANTPKHREEAGPITCIQRVIPDEDLFTKFVEKID